jgi:ribosome-associated protein
VLTDEMLVRLRMIAGTRMTADGVLVIDARRHRTQAQNREDARARLAELVRQAAIRPRRRRKTKPTRGSIEQRIESKKRRAETKRARGRIAD